MKRRVSWSVGLAFLTITTLTGTVGAQMGEALLVRVHMPGISTVGKNETLYMTSTPTTRGLKHAKTIGVKTDINLMEPSEMYWDEEKEAVSLGLTYVHIPVSADDPSTAAVQQFLAVVQEVDERQILIHCDAGGRSLAMWSIYLGTVKGCSPEMALAQAERAGLKHEGLKQFVLTYLKERSS